MKDEIKNVNQQNIDNVSKQDLESDDEICEKDTVDNEDFKDFVHQNDDLIDEKFTDQNVNDNIDSYNENKQTSTSNDEIDECTTKSEDVIAEGNDLEDVDSELFAGEEDSLLKSLFDKVEDINNKLENLSGLFEERIHHTEQEDKVIDRMHDELQQYKKDILFQLKMPILKSIIDIHESIIDITNHYKKKPEDERMIPLDTFSSYKEDLSIILEDNSFVLYKSECGEPCLPLKHKVVKKIKTDDEAQNNTIAFSKGNGYIHNEKVIVPEKVEIYVFDKNYNKEVD